MNWDEYFLRMSEVVSEKSHCLSTRRGCVVVKGKRILSMGYNGPPTGYAHCENECKKRAIGFGSGEGLEYCPSSHAEINAIIQAALNGVPTNNAIIYCNFRDIPCRDCSKLLINAGIKEIVLNGEPVDYPQSGILGKDLLIYCGIKIRNGRKYEQKT